MKVVILIQLLLGFGSTLCWAAGDPDPSTQIMARLEVRKCFYAGGGSQLSCRSERPDYEVLTIDLHPNTVPNPYKASGWVGTWEGNVIEQNIKFFASIQISLEKVGTFTRYDITSQLWKDPKQPVVHEMILESLLQIPETSIMVLSETTTEGEVLQPRLSLKAYQNEGDLK